MTSPTAETRSSYLFHAWNLRCTPGSRLHVERKGQVTAVSPLTERDLTYVRSVRATPFQGGWRAPLASLAKIRRHYGSENPSTLSFSLGNLVDDRSRQGRMNCQNSWPAYAKRGRILAALSARSLE